MKRPTSVRQPAPANAQRASTVVGSSGAAASINRCISLYRAAPVLAAVNATTTTAASASPPMPSRPCGGPADSSNGSHSPKRSNVSSFLTPRRLNASAQKTVAAPPPPPPQHAQWPHDAVPNLRPIPFASPTPSGGTPSRRCARHIPALLSGTQPRSATVTTVIATKSSGSPRYEGGYEPPRVERLAAVGIFSAQKLIPKPAPSAIESSGASLPTDNFVGNQANSESANGAAQSTPFSAPSQLMTSPSAAACDRAKKRAAAKTHVKAVTVHRRSAPSAMTAIGASPPTLIPTKASQPRPLSARAIPVANKTSTAEVADGMLRAQPSSSYTSARLSSLPFQVSEATPPLAFATASRKNSAWSSDPTNRSVVLGASGATLETSVTSRRPTWLESVDEEDTVVTDAESIPVSAAANPTYPLAGGFSTALRSAAPVKVTLRTSALMTTTAPAPEPAVVKPAKKRPEAESTFASAASTADGGGAGKDQERSSGPTAAVNAKAARRSLTPESISQVRKSRGMTQNTTNAAPTPPLSSSPQTLHQSIAMAAGVSSCTPKFSSSTGKTNRSTPARGAASPSKNPDMLRGGVLPRATPTTGAPTAPAAAAAAPVVTSAPFHASEVYSQHAATILSQTLSVVRPMAPVVHVRIRPVLPSIGESSKGRRVFFLDHENVMVTRTCPGISAANASSLMPPSSLVEPTMVRRSGTNGQIVPALQLSNLNSRTRSPSSGTRGVSAAPPLRAAAGRGGGGKVLVSSTDALRTAEASAPMKAASPACFYGKDLAQLHSLVAAESLMASKTSAVAAGADLPSGTDEGNIHVSPSSLSPASENLQPLSLFPPPPLAAHHNRTTSWTSQGSEERSPSSRLSCGSPSTSVSPQQLGFGSARSGAEVSMALGTFASVSRTRPWLTTFKSFTEEETSSLYATPRELKAASTSGGACAPSSTGRHCSSGGAARGGCTTPALQHRAKGPGIERKPCYGGVSLSTASCITERRNSAATITTGVSPRKAATTAPSPVSTRRRASRSILGASVSVSAMSIPTMPKTSGGFINGAKLAEEDAVAEPKEAHHDEGRLQQQQTPLGNCSISPPGAATCGEQHYSFEFVHDEEATQADVFEESVLHFADEALLAQNVAIICYGPTGSGKTYSMMGSQVQPFSTSRSSFGSTPFRASGEKRHHGGVVSTSCARFPPQSDSNGPTPPGPGNTGEMERQIIDEAAAGVDGRGAGRDAHAVEDDDESDGASCPKLGSTWEYHYVKHTSKGNGDSAAAAARRNHQRYSHTDGGEGAALTSSAMMFECAAAPGSMTEMGILPRLVHTLLERRGEAITIRRDPGREVGGRSAHNLQSNSRPTSTLKRAGGLSLTLRDLTFYGIELYMDELCDLLDPGKRPIPTVSDTGGLEVLCQRINEARDYRISGSRGGASHGTTKTARTGGGMPITSLADLRRAYHLAHGNRVTARHAKNDASSRSHAIFLLQLDFDLIESTDEPRRRAGSGAASARDGGAAAPPLPSEHVQRVHSYVAMVDLAGCERVKQTKVEGAALREAQYINKSLSALSSVVLSLHHNNAHVPYRDSKLTRLLRPCLEGGRVLTLVHVAPCSSTEAISTLKFADQIRHIHIPTHALTATSSKHRELLDVFADLIDPMQGHWESQVRQAQLQLDRLCADVRLLYFSRAVGAIPHRTASKDALASDVVSEISAMSEVDEIISISSGDVSQEEGPQPLTENATEADKRRFALLTVMHRLMGPIHLHQRTSMRDAVRAIQCREEHRVLAHRQQVQRRIDKLQATLQELTTANAKLAKENSTPLPRDPHALELSRRIRESTEELGEYTKEQAVLISLTTALRQRLAAQDDLEAAVDEQLHKVQHRTEQAMRTLSAAVAAHPPGGPPAGSGATLPKEPTLPTDTSTTTALAMSSKDDPELRDIAHQQLSLAKELAALRLETACFEIGTGLWEGLWARAMRKEIITAMEVEVFAMERILLDRRAFSMMMTSDADVDGEDGCVGDAETGLTALPLTPKAAAYPGNGLGSVERNERDTSVTAAEHHVSAPLMHPSPESSPPGVHLSVPVSSHSALWSRLGSYLHRRAESCNGSGRVATSHRGPNKVEGGAAVPLSSLVLQRSRRDRAVDLATTTASDKSVSFATNSFSAVASSSEGLRLRSTLAPVAGVVPSSSPCRGLEGLVPNPLTALMTGEQQNQTQHQMGSISSLPSSRHNSNAAAVVAALMPLSLAGSYEEEQSMQEASLQMLLRDGIPCEVCCLGESASYTLQHYILPSSADAPLREEARHEDPATNFSAAPDRYPATEDSGATEKESDASWLASARKGHMTNREWSSSRQPCERPGGPTVGLCTTRQGRLRLVRIPRRQNFYVLEFLYTHQGLPMAPRLQAAVLGKSEDTFTSIPGKTHLEQMVDALPSVQGAAGRGGGGGSSGSTATQPQGPLREHRLFAIPLFDPTLHLHMHVLEEGIPNMTTPVAAAVGLPSGGDAPAVSGSTFEDASDPGGSVIFTSPSPPFPALCVARRPEDGPQLVVEVRGVPQTSSTCRRMITADTKQKPKSSQKRQQKPRSPKKTTARAGQAAGPALHSGQAQHAVGRSPSRPSASRAPAGARAGVWSGLVLAKRLSSGGELMLPSSCILANTGCCSLVLRFPAPFFASSALRVERVEAVVGALCGILRPSLTAPEVRPSSSLSSSKQVGSARRRLSSSPWSTSAGGTERGGSNNGDRRRSSVSRSPLSSACAPPGLEVVDYAHIPYTLFLSSGSPIRSSPSRATSVGDGVEGLGYGPFASGHPSASFGNAAVLASASSSAISSDSLDDLGVLSGGVLGDTLQSSFSQGHGRYIATTMPPETSLLQHNTSLNGLPRPSRGSSMLGPPAAPLMDQRSGATLQVQFYWIATPLNMESPHLDAGRKNSSGAGCSSANDGGGDNGAARRHTIGSRFPPQPNTHTTASTDTSVEAAEVGVDRLVRSQVKAALSILAQFSYVLVDGRPRGDVADVGEGTAASSLGSTLTASFSAHDVRRPFVLEHGSHRRSQSEADAARFRDAVAVTSLLRQLDTYRHRIRRLFRQQLYDAEDIIGDDVAPPALQSWLSGELGRGAYLREVQGEVKRTVGLPASTVLSSTSGGAAPLLITSSDWHSRGDDRGTDAALLEPESGDAGPNTQVTVTDAREACVTTVPWTVWQWAYRWPLLHRLLRRDSVTRLGSGDACPAGRPCVSQAEGTSAWLPMAAHSSSSAALVTVTSSPFLASCSMVASPTFASSSSSSDEGFVMEGDWLTEAKLAARSKRVWLPEVFTATVPSYLENCSYAGL
ncbi:kinesin, putative [Leishmania guyanensis]